MREPEEGGAHMNSKEDFERREEWRRQELEEERRRMKTDLTMMAAAVVIQFVALVISVITLITRYC